MAKHKAIIVGAGRIGAGYGDWADPAYTHAGAYMALKDRVELVGFVDEEPSRLEAAEKKWGVRPIEHPDALEGVDIVSVCVPPAGQEDALMWVPSEAKGIWCEKPYICDPDDDIPTQVNYLRRADPKHREIAEKAKGGYLHVTGKHDLTTWCHFRDLARWWEAKYMSHEIVDGPCAYSYLISEDTERYRFPNGGINPGECMKLMLKNLLDHIDKGVPLYSPPYQI